MATRRIWTSLAKGELSPLLEGRPDLVAHNEGAKTLENWLLLRQGGVTRRPGLRFVREAKKALDTILLPFEFSVNDAFIIELGEFYARFYKNRANLLAFSGGPPVEVVSPYIESQLRALHFTQSANVVWLFNVNHIQRRLSRISDTNWALNSIIYRPPPSFEIDTDISGGTTLTPGAISGTSVLFTASGAVFLEADVGRLIIHGASRAVITGFGASAADTTTPNTKVRADILDDFPDILPPVGPDILTGWKLRLSPQATLDPDKKEPIGTQITLVAGKPAFRAADLGKFIVIYGGLIKITNFDSVTQVKGELLSVMSVVDANPAPSPAGAWTLEEASWSGTHGFPRTGEFVQGRLVQAATLSQPTSFWMSASDDFDNYAIGIKADRAIDYTIAARRVNRIEVILDHVKMFMLTAGAEFKVESGKTDEPFGGDVIPDVKPTSREGSAPVQPIILNNRPLFLDRSQKKIFALGFSIEEDTFKATEVTAAAEHITGTGIRLGPIAYTTRPDPRAYFVREDGQLVALTFFVDEKVVGFTRFVTDGTFEAVAAIPQPGGAPDQVWVIVKRIVSGQTRRYIEFFENEATDAVPGPGVFLESTGNGQAWFKGEYTATANATSPIVPLFISDTTVLAFYTYDNASLRYKRSLDGGITFPLSQILTPASFRVMAGADTTIDPNDLLPERRVFIVVLTNEVWTSRNVLQPDPSLSTWNKVTIPNTNLNGVTARGQQVLVWGADTVTPTRMTMCVSNDFGVTFPNRVVMVSNIGTGDVSNKQLAVSTGVDVWVVLNSNTGDIYRSTNNGVSWTTIVRLTGTGTANRACLLNIDDLILVAVFSATVWRSVDGGLTWVEIVNLGAAGGNIITMGYFGKGIIGGFIDTTVDAAAGGTIEWRSENYGLSWTQVPVDAGFDVGNIGSTYVSRMAVQGPRAVIGAGGDFAGGSTQFWYCPSTLISIGPGESIKFADRPWTSLQTDSAIVYVSPTPTNIIPGLSHLEGRIVNVVADGSFRGTHVVSMGSVVMPIVELYQRFEVGLHYNSFGVTMRPTVEGVVTEGLPRSWNSLFLRLDKTVGGKINGRPISYVPSDLGTLGTFTGDRKVTGGNWDREGRVTFEQTEPYPMTVLAIFGELSYGDHD